jgi:hypothetical protein
MSDNNNFGFAKLVPGFDFLQNLAKGASQGMPQMPTLSNWVAPTLSIDELEKRIAELKAVHFWLEQNGRALGATIQALEVQKMTLATLQGMNMSMGELANSLKLKTTETMANNARRVGEAAEAAANAMSGAAEAVSGAARKKAAATKAESEAEDEASAGAEADAGAGAGEAAGAASKAGGAAPVDPLQWWGALTQQFQQIAASAMKDVAQKTAADTARNMADGAAREAMKAASRKGKASGGKGGKSASASPAPAAAPAEAPAKGARKTATKTSTGKAPAPRTRAKKTSS